MLGALVALAVGYLNDCFSGLGLSPPGAGAPAQAVEPTKVEEAEPAKVEPATQGQAAKLRVVVEGELCRLDGAGEARSCEAVCAELAEGATVEVEATAGAQRTVEALRGCLQGRGVKAKVEAE